MTYKQLENEILNEFDEFFPFQAFVSSNYEINFSEVNPNEYEFKKWQIQETNLSKGKQLLIRNFLKASLLKMSQGTAESLRVGEETTNPERIKRMVSKNLIESWDKGFNQALQEVKEKEKEFYG